MFNTQNLYSLHHGDGLGLGKASETVLSICTFLLGTQPLPISTKRLPSYHYDHSYGKDCPHLKQHGPYRIVAIAHLNHHTSNMPRQNQIVSL